MVALESIFVIFFVNPFYVTSHFYAICDCIRDMLSELHTFLRIHYFQHDQWLITKHVYHCEIYIDYVSKKKLDL